MTRTFLGLGSNLGDRLEHLVHAVDALCRQENVNHVSDVYETDPVGGPDQANFLNLVVELDTDLRPVELLQLCQSIEQSAGRLREERWGPRSLDVDVLWIDGIVSETAELEVPHPRMFQRRFVLAPLIELAPDLVTATQLEGSEGRVVRLGTLAEMSASAVTVAESEQ